MSFKVLFENKISAVQYKQYLLYRLTNDSFGITINDVYMDTFMKFDDSEDADTKGWTSDDINEIKKARVREVKDGYALYLPDPRVFKEYIENTSGPGINVEMTDPEELIQEALNMQDKAYADYLIKSIIDAMSYIRDGRRKCMIWKKSRKKDVVAEEWPCWFHCWASNHIVKDDGTVVDQLLAVCEFQDGHVERINFDHIRFVEEWE